MASLRYSIATGECSVTSRSRRRGLGHLRLAWRPCGANVRAPRGRAPRRGMHLEALRGRV